MPKKQKCRYIYTCFVNFPEVKILNSLSSQSFLHSRKEFKLKLLLIFKCGSDKRLLYMFSTISILNSHEIIWLWFHNLYKNSNLNRLHLGSSNSNITHNLHTFWMIFIRITLWNEMHCKVIARRWRELCATHSRSSQTCVLFPQSSCPLTKMITTKHQY